MAAITPAAEEFSRILAKNLSSTSTHHPADALDYRCDEKPEELDEDTQLLEKMIENNMRMKTCSRRPCLPHHDFDKGRTTGVKGVIADARSYEEARKNVNMRMTTGHRPTLNRRASICSFLKEAGEGSDTEDESFIETWRQQRRLELQQMGHDVRNRRTSPSVRRYGRFDDVDALGYLDAIEKVTPDTIVVVLVYDPECAVTKAITDALTPIVSMHPAIHFVRVHYADIEFDNAGVPAILAYKEQGKLFANLTYVIDHIPADAFFNTRTLENVLRKHGIL
ncbi:Phosducin-like protein [Erysiphe necator]|uniref:Putative phosducin n=1 Tax=Uncinula necator TaxID=52586 RepID=A0A0B1PD76_UNCNE|nr:Phosducin-like protein [Erysiphe necator]KHJ34881.1 putative phosducin [Erysiphe necator]